MNISPLTAAVLADIDKLAARQNRDDDAGGSFWENTGRKHRELIECHGFETFKRHLNWQYGSWPITKYSSRFTLFCLLALLRRGKLPWTVTTQIDWRNAKPAPVWRSRYLACTLGGISCRGHLYLSGHHRLKERVGLEKLNYPSRWVSLFSQSHDVFPLWVEKVFSIE